MKIVLDTSAIIAGLHFDDGNEYLLVNETLEELKERDVRMRVEIAEKEGVIGVARSHDRSFRAVKKRIQKLGEEEALSDADVMTLSLAFELQEKGEDVILATDDFGIQNIARSLSIQYASIAERGIKKVLAWQYVCKGCGQEYDKNILFCEICGSQVKRRVKRG
jgi:rRNA maturation endonuclease Nob1